MSDTTCYVCGLCWWSGCENDADYRLDVDLKRNGLPLYTGEIELCAGHAQYAQRTLGRLDLKWEALEQAHELKTRAKA